MISQDQIGWGSYDVYEGPFYRGTERFKRSSAPTRNDNILATITATEGGAWNAVNMYDRCVCTVGLIQWCEAGQFSVSDMLGAAFERDPELLTPLGGVMNMNNLEFKKNARGRWRFFFKDARGEVDRLDEQRAMFFKAAQGFKNQWDHESLLYAKDWAAALATVYQSQEAIQSQLEYTAPRLFNFALPYSKTWVQHPNASATPIGQAFVCAFLSFAANNPLRADNSMKVAMESWKEEPWTMDWLVHVLESLTFSSGVSIYPHRYELIRPVLESIFSIDLPDHSEQLKGNLSPKEIQEILVSVLGYDLGKSGPHGDGVDGVWGKKSKAALADFERRQGLTSDGLPDARTNAALVAARAGA